MLPVYCLATTQYQECINTTVPQGFLAQWHTSRTTDNNDAYFLKGGPLVAAISRKRALVAACDDAALGNSISPTAAVTVSYSHKNVNFKETSYVFISATESFKAPQPPKNNYNMGMVCIWPDSGHAVWGDADCSFIAGKQKNVAVSQFASANDSYVYFDALEHTITLGTKWRQAPLVSNNMWLGITSAGVRLSMGNMIYISPDNTYDIAPDSNITIKDISTQVLNNTDYGRSNACAMDNAIFFQPQAAVEARSSVGFCIGSFRGYSVVSSDANAIYIGRSLVQGCKSISMYIYIGWLDFGTNTGKLVVYVTNATRSVTIQAYAGNSTDPCQTERMVSYTFLQEDPSTILGPAVDYMEQGILAGNNVLSIEPLEYTIGSGIFIRPTATCDLGGGSIGQLYDLGIVKIFSPNATTLENVYMTHCSDYHCSAEYCVVMPREMINTQQNANIFSVGVGDAASSVSSPMKQQLREQFHNTLNAANVAASWPAISLVCVTLGVAAFSAPYTSVSMFVIRISKRYSITLTIVAWTTVIALTLVPAGATYAALITAGNTRPMSSYAEADDTQFTGYFKQRIEYIYYIEAEPSLQYKVEKQVLIVLCSFAMATTMLANGIYTTVKQRQI